MSKTTQPTLVTYHDYRVLCEVSLTRVVGTEEVHLSRRGWKFVIQSGPSFPLTAHGTSLLDRKGGFSCYCSYTEVRSKYCSFGTTKVGLDVESLGLLVSH